MKRPRRNLGVEERLREELQEQINGKRRGHSYRPKFIPVDSTVFEKTKEERLKLKEMKRFWKENK